MVTLEFSLEESEADKQLTDGLIAVWSLKSHWSQDMLGYYSNTCQSCVHYILKTDNNMSQTAHSVASCVTTHQLPAVSTPTSSLLTLQTRLLELVVALAGSFWTVQQCPQKSLCLPLRVFWATGVFLSTLWRTRRERPLSLFVTKTLSSSHQFSKS